MENVLLLDLISICKQADLKLFLLRDRWIGIV